jgi:hypothetical protein
MLILRHKLLDHLLIQQYHVEQLNAKEKQNYLVSKLKLLFTGFESNDVRISPVRASII